MRLNAGDVMKRPVVTVTGDTPLKKAAEILDENDFSGMPVVDDQGRLVGILSEKDILRYTQQIVGQPLRDPHRVFTKGKEVLHIDITHRGVEVIELVAATSVEMLMTVDVYSAGEDTPILDVVRMICENCVNRIPVVDSENRVKGIITRGDLMTIMLNHWPAQV